MNLDVSAPLAGILALNLVALALLVTVELGRGRSKPTGARSTDARPTEPPAVSLDSWIDEIEAAEQRQAVAASGEFLPRQQSAANG